MSDLLEKLRAAEQRVKDLDDSVWVMAERNRDLRQRLAEARREERERCSAEIREVARRFKARHYADSLTGGMANTMEEMAAHLERLEDAP